MKLTERVKRMADGLEREGTRLTVFIVTREDVARHVVRVFEGNIAALRTAENELRNLLGAEKAIMLAGLDRLVVELRKDYDEAEALAGVEIGGKDTVLAGLAPDNLLAYGKAQRLKQLIPQIEAMRRIGEKDQ